MIIGITGSLCTGKSTVAGFLASERGAIVLDADKIAHECVQPGGPAYKAVISSFGKSIIGKDQWIDRQQLGRIVFLDPAKLRKLCRIIHPCVQRRFKEETAKFLERNSQSLLVFDVPLLIETGVDCEVDVVVVATTTIQKQTERATGRFGLSEQEALRRIQAQLPLREKAKRAHFVISTSG
ncbi:MAG: dephospho-CoA kinase, partial [Candidatus Omnitrophica bacterium]|nr:dephospho-CoA kinase [Candidatus Omnitrophota bacterium]